MELIQGVITLNIIDTDGKNCTHTVWLGPGTCQLEQITQYASDLTRSYKNINLTAYCILDDKGKT